MRSPEEVSRIAKAHILQRRSRSECCGRNKHSITIKCYGWDVPICLIGSMYLEDMRAVELSGQLRQSRSNTVLAQTDKQTDSRQTDNQADRTDRQTADSSFFRHAAT